MRDWQAVHADATIQFSPITIPPPQIPVTPEWLKMLGRFLENLFGPFGKLLGMNWAVFQYVLIGLAVIGVLAVLFVWLRPLLARRKAADDEVDEWLPSQQQALGLLAEADRLAADGQYDEAAHLLLQRSVHHIAYSRPEWLHPASTAREIAGLSGLSDPARAAFTAIANLVERSRYALRPLVADDWQAARNAYAGFAQGRIAA